MGFSKIEVNLRRLLAAAPQQHNQAKLVHYVATLQEQLAEESSFQGLSRFSKAPLINEFSEKIEAIADKLVATVSQKLGFPRNLFLRLRSEKKVLFLPEDCGGDS
ncbi:hypothetical protein CASFOL_008569 [Castilleja foliolosa]|uniref:Uncharacterized protein n=1 Tax=Castilleja foliolosa TaxID=1961234 RepID=A0ABD3DZC8_9LAMI